MRGVSTRKSGRNNCAISECASRLIITITVSFGCARSDERAAGMRERERERDVRLFNCKLAREILHALRRMRQMIKQHGIIINFALC